MANPLAGLAKVLQEIDKTAREVSGKCPKCGKDKGGLVLAGETKKTANICICEQKDA